LPPIAHGKIAAAHADLADPLAAAAGARVVKDHDRHVACGITDGQDPGSDVGAAIDPVLAGQAGFGGAEPDGEQGIRLEVRAKEFDIGRERLIAFEPNDAHRRKARRGAHHRPEDQRHRVVHGDPLLVDPARQRREPEPAQRIGTDRPAVQQRREEARHRSAEARRLDQGQAVLRGDAQVMRVTHHVVQHVAVAVDHPLGLPGGSRRVEEIREATRRERHPRVCGGPRRESLVDPQHAPPVAGQHRGQFAMGCVRHDEACARVVEHRAQPGRRMRRVQRNIELARLQRAQDRDHRVRPLIEQERNRLLRVAQPRAEGRRNAIGRAVELVVRERAVERAHRGRARLRGGHLLEARGNGLLDVFPPERAGVALGPRGRFGVGHAGIAAIGSGGVGTEHGRWRCRSAPCFRDEERSRTSGLPTAEA